MLSIQKRLAALTALGFIPLAVLLLAFIRSTGAAGAAAPASTTVTATTSIYLPLIAKPRLADLSISKSDGQANALTGSVITYTIVVANNGPDDVTSAVVTDVFPSTITSVNWSCGASGGAACGSLSGSENISLTVDLPVTGTVVITASGTFSGSTTNTVYVATPANVSDPNPSNNRASDTTVGDWLAYINYYRAIAHLPPVTENTAWSYGAQQHARYMVCNDVLSHTEDSTKACYSPEGNLAGQNSNVMLTTDINYTDFQAIDLWMRGPFHGIGILDAQLLQVGFGSFREAGTGPGPVDWQMGAVLDILRGLTTSVPANVSFPVMWPGSEATIYIRAYTGFEFPDPLTSCPGYVAHTGMPIYLQVGAGNLTPVVTYTLITNRSGSPVEHCRFDESTYFNPDPDQQATARSVLGARDAIVLIPRSPFSLGERYTVTVKANGQTYTWSFDVSNSAMLLPREPEARVVVR